MADRFDLINFSKSVTTTLGGVTANVNIDANTLFVDGTNNRVGIGTNAPVNVLQVRGIAGGGGESLARFTGNSTFNGIAIQSSLANSTTSSASFLDTLNESGACIASLVGEIATDGSSAYAFTTQTSGTRTDRRAERMRIAGSGTVSLGVHSGAGSSILSLNGTVVCSTDQEAGRTYEAHNFNTYPKLYSSVFINVGASSNIPASSTGNGYRFVMGAGDTGGRGFDLVGTSAGQLYYRARENGTWYLTSASVPSDYRIKQDIIPIDSSIETLKLINAVSYRFKDIPSPAANNTLQWADDGKNHLGFIAHELKEVIPSAVNGEKDAVTDVGGIQPQTLNVMPIVALLTSALQEAVSKIETLEARIEALENK